MENETPNVQSTDQQLVEETQTEQQEKPVQDEKRFTQDEVNGIIEKRLKRERERMNNLLNADSPEKIELDAREREITKRELQLEVRDILEEKKLPLSLMDVLNYESREACEKSIEVFGTIVKEAVKVERMEHIKGGKPLKKSTLDNNADIKEDISQAFGL